MALEREELFTVEMLTQHRYMANLELTCPQYFFSRCFVWLFIFAYRFFFCWLATAVLVLER